MLVLFDDAFNYKSLTYIFVLMHQNFAKGYFLGLSANPQSMGIDISAAPTATRRLFPLTIIYDP